MIVLQKTQFFYISVGVKIVQNMYHYTVIIQRTLLSFIEMLHYFNNNRQHDFLRLELPNHQSKKFFVKYINVYIASGFFF